MPVSLTDGHVCCDLIKSFNKEKDKKILQSNMKNWTLVDVSPVNILFKLVCVL